MYRRHTLVRVAVWAFVCVMVPVSAGLAAPLKVDLSNSGDVEPGWTDWSAGSRLNDTNMSKTFSTDFAAALTISFDSVDTRNRAQVDDAVELHDLIEDCFKEGGPVVMRLQDLPPGIYAMTTWHHDPLEDVENDDGTVTIRVSDANGTTVVADHLQQSWGPAPEEVASATFTIVSDGTEIVITFADNDDGIHNEAHLNGFTLEPLEVQTKAFAPDPADGAVAVSNPLLQWKGPAAMWYEVYFGTDPNLEADDLVSPQSPMAIYWHGPGLTPGQTYYWRVDSVDLATATVYRGDVWSFLAQPLTAYMPDPADGATDGSLDPNMAVTWLPGLNVLLHHVYFSDSFADVNDRAAAADMGVVEDPNLAAGPLLPLTTYYWRVDETDLTGTVQPGEVWSFTTYAAVDDFEAYSNEIGSRPFEVWIDGIGFSQPEPGNPGNATGAAVGHDIWSADSPHFEGQLMETSIAYGGVQSMPVDYNNVNAPYYSEIERTWAVPQDWTAGGVATLVLHVHGQVANDAVPLSVRLEDSSARNGLVAHPDPEVTRKSAWVEWEIPLSEFADAGVNVSGVTKMSIGFGSRDAAAPGGAGTVLVDEIWLTRPAPAANDDGVVE